MNFKYSFTPQHQEHSLKRRLFIYMLLLVFLLLFTLFSGLLLFGRFSSTKKDFLKILELQMEVFEKDMTSYWEEVAAMGIHLSSTLTDTLETTLTDNQISFLELTDNHDAIAQLEDAMLDPLCLYLRQSNCSGAFVLLETTTNSTIEQAETSRSGLYIQKSGIVSPDSPLLLYRGIAQIGKDHQVMPHRKWRQEFQTTLFPDYDALISAAAFPLDTAYSLSELVQLPGTSEQVALMIVPLLSKEGNVYGFCGFEISQSWFKEHHAQPSNLSHMLCMMTTNGETLDAERSFSAGIQNSYYFSPKGTLKVSSFGKNLTALTGESETYVGLLQTLTISSSDTCTLAVMIPKSDYTQALFKMALQLILVSLFVIFFAVVCCQYFSKRFLRPVLRGLEQIRASKAERSHLDIHEIDDLLDFLSEKELETEEKFKQLEKEMIQSQHELTRIQTEHASIQQKYESTQEEISKLAASRKKEVDPEEYQRFLECLSSLTNKETEILNLYTHGKTSKEILLLANITENTLKYHNRNIYSKLGVKSRKQLLMYTALMNHKE